jgi:hypothetical protein
VAKKVWSSPSGDSRGGAYNRGTCRMGNDPKTSVVDKYVPRRGTHRQVSEEQKSERLNRVVNT